MKLTTIYKQKVQDLSKDIVLSILNYSVSMKLEEVMIEDELDTFTLSVKKGSIITENGEEYKLTELQIDSLLYILEKLESGAYEKIK